MLISKFHRMIQSKLLWLSFLVIVIFSFVIWGTVTPDASDLREATAPGTLDGEPVDPDVFQQAFFNTYLSVVLALGRAIEITPSINEQLRQAAWQRLAAIRSASRLGITATDDEVANTIQQLEPFQFEGKFNVMAYKAFAQNFLGRFGAGERQFEEYIRQEIILQKTRHILDRLILITPYELRRAFHSVTDQFDAEFVVLKPSLVESEVRVSDEDARKFYNEEPERFRRPEQVRVDYVRISALPFIPRVRVTDDEIQAYYDEHLTNYVIESDTDAPGEDTNLFGRLTRYRPLEEVKQEISNLLLERKAMDEAYETAMNFVLALTPDRDGRAFSFEEVAARFERTVLSLPPFALNSSLEGIQNPRAFRSAAFELAEGPETYFSNPIRGSNEVYIIALRERIPSRIPSFEEIRDEALRAARAKAIRDALMDRAKSIREETEKALAEKISFRDTLAFYNLSVKTTGVFSATTDLDLGDEDLEDLVESTVMFLNQGEISEPLWVDDDILLVHLAMRKPAENVSYEAMRQQLADNIRRQLGRQQFDGWQQQLLRAANFQDNQRRQAEEPEENVEPVEG